MIQDIHDTWDILSLICVKITSIKINRQKYVFKLACLQCTQASQGKHRSQSLHIA